MWYEIQDRDNNVTYGIGPIPGRRGPKRICLYKLANSNKEVVATFKTEEQAMTFLELFMKIADDANEWRRATTEFIEPEVKVECVCPECEHEFDEVENAHIEIGDFQETLGNHHIISFATRS